MNSFGRLFRINIFGESHGECIGIVIDGCPAGIPLTENDLIEKLEKRKSGQKGTTARKEEDMPKIKSGIFKGKTTGAPIMILIENMDIDSSKYEKLKDTPRPGHADFTAFKKFHGFNDYRGGGHFSGRLTACLVIAGVIAKKLLRGIEINAKVIEVGGTKDIQKALDKAIAENDSVGGVVECRTKNLPIGLGEPFFDSVESSLSHAAFSIPAIKGIEFGSGFKSAEMQGHECNDEIINAEGKTKTNNAGGINGGITNGNELIFRVAVKPTSSILREQKTIDLKTGKVTEIKIEGRHDSCIALRIPVILEAITAIVFADLKLINDIYQNMPKTKVKK
ncbi:MAG: chorismate synthase [archaeon]